MKRGPAVEDQLGFRPECACKHLAVTAIQTHPVDDCAGSVGPGEVRLLCGRCLEDELVEIQGLLLDAFLGLRPPACTGCGLTIDKLSAIIVQLKPLWVWPD